MSKGSSKYFAERWKEQNVRIIPEDENTHSERVKPPQFPRDLNVLEQLAKTPGKKNT